jgi:hypothetical protein
MPQIDTDSLDSWAKPDASDSGGDELERLEQRRQADPWRRVLVADNYGGFALGAAQFLQLKAVSSEADVALVRVKEV